MLSAQAIPKYAEDIDEFDNEFRIKENLSPNEKAKEAARLRAVEAEINEENAKYAKGEAHFGEKLYEFSDLSKEEFEKNKEGMIMPVTRAMGMFMPPESERNTPENQAKLDVMYDITNRAYVPRSYNSKSLGEKREIDRRRCYIIITNKLVKNIFFRTCYCGQESRQLWVLRCFCCHWPA